MDDFYCVTKRTCACTSSSNRMKRMERQLPNSFVFRYVITPSQLTSNITRHIFPSSKMYACTVTRTDVERAVPRFGNTHRSYASTSVLVRGCVESILAAYTIRINPSSNVWTTFECPNCWGTTRTEPPLTLSVCSTPNNFSRTETIFTGLRVTSR